MAGEYGTKGENASTKRYRMFWYLRLAGCKSRCTGFLGHFRGYLDWYGNCYTRCAVRKVCQELYLRYAGSHGLTLCTLKRIRISVGTNGGTQAMYKVAIALRDVMEVSYMRTSVMREALNAYGMAVLTLLGDEGTDADYIEAMQNAFRAATDTTMSHSTDPWTYTYRFYRGYVRLTGAL